MRRRATSIAGSWTPSPAEPPVTDAGWRRSNLGHLLFVATGLMIRDKLATVHRAGFAGMTDAQLAVVQQLGADGDRLTALAARAGLTKQSMIELVDRAERQGLLTRELDPDDRRAKIVRLTGRGRALREVVQAGMQAAERRFGDLVGADALAAVMRALLTYAGEEQPGLEGLLASAGRRFARDVLAAAHGRGHGAVTEALLGLFRHLDLDGARLTAVATAARITKQSMRALVERAEALGLVERGPAPDDGRARIIRFSEAGTNMLDDMREGVGATEAKVAALTGAAALAEVKAALTIYITAADQT